MGISRDSILYSYNEDNMRNSRKQHVCALFYVLYTDYLMRIELMHMKHLDKCLPESCSIIIIVISNNQCMLALFSSLSSTEPWQGAQSWTTLHCFLSKCFLRSLKGTSLTWRVCSYRQHSAALSEGRRQSTHSLPSTVM